MEADFQRVYGIDLGGLWRGQFTIRRASALAAHLPSGAQCWRFHNYDDSWTHESHLLALVADRLRGEDADQVPRPSDSRERTRYEDVTETKAEQWARGRAREAAALEE